MSLNSRLDSNTEAEEKVEDLPRGKVDLQVYRVEFKIQELGCKWSLRFRVESLKFRVKRLGFRIKRLFKIERSGLWVCLDGQMRWVLLERIQVWDLRFRL